MGESVVDSTFPVWGLLPKKETQVTTFTSKYPEYDGRGIVIAIFDSGVDPGAPGLQKTSDGKRKVLERYDCSGCGDVTTTTIVRPTDDGYLTGLTGRTLKIPKGWNNPTNKYRLGVKSAFDLYPKRLKERIQEERKTKLWDIKHKSAVAEANRALAKFEDSCYGKQTLSEEEKLKKEDLEVQVDHLLASEKKYNDLGPVYDCILFHDGTKWLACVDTSERGDLDDCPLLGEYSLTHDFAPLTPTDQLNFSINVHGDGDVLELVGLCSSHGTHVASIASAYFSENNELNGVAPGAQIISLTIGDGRLGSMETGTALVRAMIKVMELSNKYPIRVINMSYGEHAHWSNSGRIGDLMIEVVNKYGIVWVASAGNHGPALSTIGTPPDISQDIIIGVAAYVSPDMMVAEYSLRQKLSGTIYTWSSRGPTIDGGFGVSICAPGGAITSVPNFTLRNAQLMNGTSMAAPHVAGSVALILSGLCARKLFYSPYGIKRALENCAHCLENVETLAQGFGLLQVDKAFSYLEKHCDTQERDVQFRITCGSGTNKGIYIRTKELRSVYEYSITVEPSFMQAEREDRTAAAAADLIKAQLDFNIRLALVCKSTFVNYPTHLDLSNMARSFSIKIDLTGLNDGVHHTSVDAFDVSCVNKGPIFRIPITVIKPTTRCLDGHNKSINFDKVLFQPDTIKRHFVVVPEYGTWAVLRIRCTEQEQTGRFVVHTMHILPKQSCKSLEMNKTLSVTSNVETAQAFQVRGGSILEVVIAKYWANLGDTVVDYSISFHGIKPNYPSVTMHAADGVHSLEVTTLQGEDIQPNIVFKNSVQILRPNESKICPLTSRDVIPKGRQIYQLLLNYSFHLNKAADVSPNCALLSDVLYESEFESQLWMLYDTNKQFMGCGDAYPSKYSLKLEKGDYTIKLQSRHEKKDYLDKLVDTPMLISQKLATPVSLDIYGTHSQAVVGGKKTSFGQTTTSSTLPLYIPPLPIEKYSLKNNNNAQYLTGTITFAKDELAKKVDTYSIKYILYENNKRPSKSLDKEKPKMEEYKENVRDLKISFLNKLDAPAAEKLYEELCSEFSDFLPVHSAYLQAINASFDPKQQLPAFNNYKLSAQDINEIEKVLKICNKVLDGIDTNSILAQLAIRNDQRPDALKLKSVMERQKSVLIDCLCHKGVSLSKFYHFTRSAAEGELLAPEYTKYTLDDISAVWTELLKFVDPSDTKTTGTTVLYFAIWHATVNKHVGRYLKFLSKLQEDKNSRDIDDKLIEIYAMLGWDHMVYFSQNHIPFKYPSECKPF